MPQGSAQAGPDDPARPLLVAPLTPADPAPRLTDDGADGKRGELAQVETPELMRRLRAGDGSTVAGARAELVRRGFTKIHLELARRLFDPDPNVRRELARLLPGVQGIRPGTWLWWLSRDDDPEVRLTAITLLATTGERAVLDRVEGIARNDPDPRIRRQAERIARRRDENLK
jgi:hypothetical protein